MKARAKNRLPLQILIIAALVVISGCNTSDPVVRPATYREPTEAELAAAHRYHGILYAEEDASHEWYFMREGKRCRLFSYRGL